MNKKLLRIVGQVVIVDTPGPTFEEVLDAPAPPVPVEVPAAVLDAPAPPVLVDVPAAAKRRRLRGKQAPP